MYIYSDSNAEDTCRVNSEAKSARRRVRGEQCRTRDECWQLLDLQSNEIPSVMLRVALLKAPGRRPLLMLAGMASSRHCFCHHEPVIAKIYCQRVIDEMCKSQSLKGPVTLRHRMVVHPQVAILPETEQHIKCSFPVGLYISSNLTKRFRRL